MKSNTLSRFTATLAGLPVLFAFTTDSPLAATTVQSSAHMGAGMPMSSMPMHSQMTHMRDVMESIEQNQDPAERQRLMDEHMEAMQGMMQMMHGMMAGQDAMHRHGATQGPAGAGDMPGRMAPRDPAAGDMGMGMGMGMGRSAGGDPDLAARVDMLVERLDAMQLLVDQLLRAHRQMMGTRQ